VGVFVEGIDPLYATTTPFERDTITAFLAFSLYLYPFLSFKRNYAV